VTAIRLRRLEALVFRYPLKTPVTTSFGTMRDRPAVFVRVEDADGHVGWGEAWCNFPMVGAEHRARLITDIIAPLILDKDFDGPRALFEDVSAKTAVLALQTGEPGPIAQAIAGIDIAVWDLAARRAGVPLWRLLGGTSPAIRVYASGINPTAPEHTVARAKAQGHRAFKLKVGFGADTDLRNLRAVREVIGPDAHFAVDANQAWDLAQAQSIAPALDAFDLAWIEEPMRADCSWQTWRALRGTTRTPLAAGENIAGQAAFETALQQKIFRFVQPDMAKWGGFSGTLPVARMIRESGATFCPHYLGGGIGLLASAHLLAAAGGDGLLEMDINENSLRDDVIAPALKLVDGTVSLPETPGLGCDFDPSAIGKFRVRSSAV
jgi:L-alanine-DL-glutamate epimerase-like enolase superfamily enzyme